MVAFVVLATILLNILGLAGPLVDSLNAGLHLHLDGATYFIAMFILGLFF